MAQVGMERALAGSVCVTNGNVEDMEAGRSPIPRRKAECSWKPRVGPIAIVAMKAAKVPTATFLNVSSFG